MSWIRHTNNQNVSSFFGCVIASIVLLGAVGCQSTGRSRGFGQDKQGIRAIWVTRWDYKTPRDISTIMEDCRRAGFTTVLFQVRGNGTAFYRSKIEPWADELGGRDPGFDPLSVACQAAHDRKLAIHAWVNVMPGWRGDEPPKNKRQLYHAKANWFWRDQTGRRQRLGWYASLNPCYPQVRAYLVDVMHEIVANYPIDGLHLDYIRFPNEWNDSYPPGATVPDYPRDPKTLAMFHRATGRSPDEAPQQWSQWRTEQVTKLVRDIHDMVRKTKSKVILSAAVGSDPVTSKRTHFQDARLWIAKGLLDAVFPMCYGSDMRTFAKQIHTWLPYQSRLKVICGVNCDQRDPALVAQQIDYVKRTGGHFSAFAYNSLFERLDDQGHRLVDATSKTRASLRRVLATQKLRMVNSNGRLKR